MSAAAKPIAAEGGPGELRWIRLEDLHESPWNPRKHFDAAKLAETAESLKVNGQLTPITVRPFLPGAKGPRGAGGSGGYEIGAGHRRFRAAPIAGLTHLLAVVRPLDDVAFLELLTIENKQREDVTPLDEAAGFRLLMEKAGYDVPKLAARIGLSTKYVYDRVKLLQLIPELRKYLEAGTITAGHGILLARLTPAEQKKVMGNPSQINRYGYRDGTGLFQAEYAEDDPDQPELELKHPVKARSVREVATWINDHVRFRPEHNDLPNLFPAAAVALEEAKDDDLAPVYITYDHQLSYDAKDHKVRTYGVVSWRRADGQEKSKTCAWSRIGIVAGGRDRGDAFRVCVNREKCAVHFPASARKAKRRKAASAQDQGDGGYSIQANLRRQAEDAKRDAERARWDKAESALLKALAAKLRTAPAGATSEVARIVLDECTAYWGLPGKAIRDLVPVGRTAEDVLRRAAWLVILDDDDNAELAKTMKAFGISAQAIVDRVAPKPAEKKAAKTPAKKKAKK